MTFKKFEELFMEKYPNGAVHMHGEFAGTEKSKTVTVVFSENGRGYDYYGAYEDILCRLGIKVISKRRLHEVELCLQHYKQWHGTPQLFGGVEDYSAEIERLTNEIEDLKENFIVI